MRSFRVSCFHFVYRAFFVSFVWSVRSFFVRFVYVFRSFAVGAYCKLIPSSICTSLTFQIYTPCRITVSGIYNLQDKIFRFMYPVRSFCRFLCLAGPTVSDLLTLCKTNFSDLYTLQDKLSDLYTLEDKRSIFIHPVKQTFQIYTPCRTSASDLYTLQDTLFRIIHPARQAFPIYTPSKINFSDLYALRDKRFRFIPRTRQAFQIYTLYTSWIV